MDICCMRPIQEGCPEAWTWECCGNPFVSLNGFVDPPEAPIGFMTEVKRDTFFGFVTHYRFVRKDNKQ